MYTNKNIYQFPNSNVKADPIDLRRKLVINTKGELTKLIHLYNEGTEYDQAIAEEQLVLATRQAFQLPPITDPNGFSDDTVLEYLAHFLEWLSRPQEPIMNSRPNSRPCTNCPPPRTTI